MSFAGVSIVGNGEATGHAISVSTASGYHLLVVNGYSRTKVAAPTGTMICSLPFMVGGHRWRIRYFPNGASSKYADSVSLYLALDDGNVTEALKVQYDFSFVEQLEKQDSAHIHARELGMFSSSAPSWGYYSFMKKDDLEKSKHLKDDCFTIRCDLNIATTVDLFIKVPPSSIHEHISNLLVSKEGTDVTFKVGGETFAAHRCVLAARSVVFKAKFFGPMKEGAVASIVDVEDMEASVFRALLCFVYTDSLPKMEVGMVEEEGEKVQEASWLQNLLAAADRYDLRRLKALCEEKLCEHIGVSSATTILTLAERHSCCGLEEMCLEFIKTPNLKEIAAAEGTTGMALCADGRELRRRPKVGAVGVAPGQASPASEPSLVKELIAKFAS